MVTNSTPMNVQEKEADDRDVIVATFTGGPLCTATSFTARINWGDGTTSDGYVEFNASTGSYEVHSEGSHAYMDVGTYTITTTIIDECNDMTMVSSSATVTEADLHPGTPQVFSAIEGGLASGGQPSSLS